MTVERLEDVRGERWTRLLAELAADILVASNKDRLAPARAALTASGAQMLSPDERLARAEDSLKLAQAAFTNERLRLLFPFTSIGRLCFSRCSTYPFTNDCPCIVSEGPAQPYLVFKRPYEPNLGSGVVIGESTNALDAVEMAAAALPVNAAHLWLGSNSWPRP